jgi:hypothetical protein
MHTPLPVRYTQYIQYILCVQLAVPYSCTYQISVGNERSVYAREKLLRKIGPDRSSLHTPDCTDFGHKQILYSF